MATTSTSDSVVPVTIDVLPAEKGTYVLILRLAVPDHLSIGKLGTFGFLAGWYAYVGSALGSGGLRGRLKHHLTPMTKPHWHIDYLRKSATIREIWTHAAETSNEHRWAGTLMAMPDAAVPVRGFGASDCQCLAHLVCFPEMPNFDVFCALVHASLQRWDTQKEE